MTSQEFKQTRHGIRITQADLAKIMGMTQPAIARIESGSRQPTKQQAAALRVIAVVTRNGMIECIYNLPTQP